MKLPVGAVKPTTLPSTSTSKHLLSHPGMYFLHPHPRDAQLRALSFEQPLSCYNYRHMNHNYSDISCSLTMIYGNHDMRDSKNSPAIYKLGKKWMQYQGLNHWEGLLDPLDDHLRSEILRYGQFVEAAYRSFDFDPSSPTYATCKFPRNSLLSRSRMGGTGYKITKNLRATCGVQIPRWIGSTPTWASTRSSWIGYVAVCQDKEEIARLGRRDVVIAYRGTATCLEWVENLRATLTSLHDDNISDSALLPPMVESGFLSLYTSGTDKCTSLQGMVRQEISRVMEIYGDEPLSFTVTGHSLGAALATLTAYDINSTFRFRDAPMVTVISFGGPRVGNKSFGCQLERVGTRLLRIVNSDDVITKVPGWFVVGNDDVVGRKQGKVAGMPGWLRKRVEDTQWAYAEAGRELRLSSKESPYLSKRDVATCHELSTYLHLVNGFVSSTCPFRATARKMLSRHHKEKLGFR